MLSSKRSFSFANSSRASLIITMIFLLSVGASSFAQDFRPHQLQTGPEEYSVFPPSSNLEIHIIDVERGDATLILAPNGLAILIDAGEYYGKNKGVSPLMLYLRAMGIKKIDVVILTHADDWHYGGIFNLFESNITIGEVLGGDDDLSIFNGTGVRDAAENNSLYGMSYFEPGTYLDLGKGGRLINLYASGLAADGSRIQFKYGNIDNDLHSIAILIDFAKFQYFTDGDLGIRGAENVKDVELSLAGLIGDVDVLRVGAHGGNGGYGTTSEEFVSAIKPNAAIISAGARENKGPSGNVVKRILAAGAEVLQTADSVVANSNNAFIAGSVKIVVGRSKAYKINSIKKYKDEYIPENNEAPTAMLNMSANGSDLKSVELNPFGSSDDQKIKAYFIDWGDGSRSLVKRNNVLTHAYEDAADYYVNMYVFDKYGMMGYAGTVYQARVVQPKLQVDAKAATYYPKPLSYLPLYVTVKDPDGKPVNGAKVTAYAEWYIFSSTTSGYTNSNGQVTLNLYVATSLTGIFSTIEVTATANGLSGSDNVVVKTSN